MSLVFFEGFNHSDSDNLKLDPNYWTIENGTSSYVDTSSSARTNTAIVLTGRGYSIPLSSNTVLSLSNFTDPLASKNGFGIGFYTHYNYSLSTNRTDDSSSPHNENLIAFYDNTDTEVLRIDIIATTFDGSGSMGFAIYQNSTLVDYYDIKSFFGYSWTVSTNNSFYYLANNNYFELFVDSKNNNQLSIRLTANNTYEAPLLNNSSNSIYTSITGFNSLSKIRFYGTHNNRLYDDLYLTSGDSISEALLGYNTRIYKLAPSSDGATNEWYNNAGNTTSNNSYINGIIDGDSGYIVSNTSGNASLFQFDDLPSGYPTGIGGIKINNVLRKTSITNDTVFTNVIASGDGTGLTNIGSQHTINSTTYSYKNSFVFTNPMTGNSFTPYDINNMQIGVKNLGNV